jgi:hypothetical protein
VAEERDLWGGFFSPLFCFFLYFFCAFFFSGPHEINSGKREERKQSSDREKNGRGADERSSRAAPTTGHPKKTSGRQKERNKKETIALGTRELDSQQVHLSRKYLGVSHVDLKRPGWRQDVGAVRDPRGRE